MVRRRKTKPYPKPEGMRPVRTLTGRPKPKKNTRGAGRSY